MMVRIGSLGVVCPGVGRAIVRDKALAIRVIEARLARLLMTLCVAFTKYSSFSVERFKHRGWRVLLLELCRLPPPSSAVAPGYTAF
jgi:hypothetical protein